jgi:hypothetical protein
VLRVYHVLCKIGVPFSIYSETTWCRESSHCLVGVLNCILQFPQESFSKKKKFPQEMITLSREKCGQGGILNSPVELNYQRHGVMLWLQMVSKLLSFSRL